MEWLAQWISGIGETAEEDATSPGGASVSSGTGQRRHEWRARAMATRGGEDAAGAYLPVATDPEEEDGESGSPSEGGDIARRRRPGLHPKGGFMEDVLGRQQHRSSLAPLCAAATLLGLLVLLLLLWARSADFCIREHEGRSWSAGKQRWCCALFERGCAATDSAVAGRTPPFDCTTDESAQQEWSELQQAFCCKTSGSGCEAIPPSASTSNATAKYDCAAEWSEWSVRWTVAKQAWCCQHIGRGCMAETPVAGGSDDHTAFCDTSLRGAQTWSLVKQEWCCTHRGLGCLEAVASTR